METARRILLWLRDYWYIPALALVALVGWVFLRRPVTRDAFLTELLAIKAARDARALAALSGAEAAAVAVREEHRQTLDQLTAEQTAEAARLQDDPEALARFLVHAGHQ